ncbi:uncharacterized protein LAESUDRAFT_719866 [Laetiporus sulphureus 93-53]|uniref:Uncharacterized protein n=1 Tax=Laetiporus sulphureus 93-53 TaxID=1314785 RepID=A0A165HME1_9APHY|nr:uncharacterized protein LAESUDRAFT_719866 [Laetiporus sulphureus 93-53]KZT11925.1 hypothetical protein LAESUDRAFT_719866 [Laetiporus sulphureus 93-53]
MELVAEETLDKHDREIEEIYQESLWAEFSDDEESVELPDRQASNVYAGRKCKKNNDSSDEEAEQEELRSRS